MAVRLRLEPYDPDARDADGDGIVQEWTAWERPAGARILDSLGQEIQRGLTSATRGNFQVVDNSGSPIDYTPSYSAAERAIGTAASGRPGRLSGTLSDYGYPSLAERGYRSLKEMGLPTVGEISAAQITGPTQNVASAVEAFVRAAPQNLVFPKRAARDRARRRADAKAQELAFTRGRHFVLENDSHFVILSEPEYQTLSDTFGDDVLRNNVGVAVYDRPQPQIVDLDEVRESLRGPDATDTEIDPQKYFDGVVSVHYNSGSLDEVDDEVFAAVIFDESLVDDTGNPIDGPFGNPLTFEDIMVGNWNLARGQTIENRRFTFTQLKPSEYMGDGYGGIWTVFRATDKETGDIWYVKSSTYGANDSMLENIGMRAGSLTNLSAKPDERHLRSGASIRIFKEGQRNVRWTAMRDISQWDAPDGENLVWKQSGDVGGIDADTVDVGDVAEVLVMDYLMDNTDRHAGNFMLARDSRGTQRLGIIDNGLLFGGRVYDNPALALQWDTEASADDFDDLAVLRRDFSPSEWATSPGGNQFLAQPALVDLAGRLMREPDDSDRFDDATRGMIQRMEDGLDRIYSPDYFQRRGIPLTPTEKAHLEAAKTVALGRLEFLKSNPYALREFLEVEYGRRLGNNEPSVA